MRTSAWLALKEAAKANGPAVAQTEVLNKKRVMYRYARPSQSVFGTITCFTYDIERVYVKWDDGKLNVQSLKALELIS